jgi:protein-disulfide isomerase
MKSAIVLAIVACVGLVAVSAQPVQKRIDGFANPANGPLTAPVIIDKFADLLCPDCAASWPTLKQVSAYYGNQVHIRVHTFPLPYHTWSMLACMGPNIIQQKTNSSNAIFKYIELMYAQQATYWNDPTADIPANRVITMLGDMVQQAGILDSVSFQAGLRDYNLNVATRASWKYGCSRGVFGTPTYHVNGVVIPYDLSWTLADWQKLINPLLA